MRRSKVPLFDHLVGPGEQCWWYAEAKGLRGLQIYQKLEFARLFYRQLARFASLDNSPSVEGDLTIGVGEARAVAGQRAGFRKLPPFEDRRTA